MHPYSQIFNYNITYTIHSSPCYVDSPTIIPHSFIKHGIFERNNFYSLRHKRLWNLNLGTFLVAFTPLIENMTPSYSSVVLL